MKYQGWHLRVIKDRGRVGVVVWQDKQWQFTAWGFKSHREALKWGRRQVDEVFTGRVK